MAFSDIFFIFSERVAFNSETVVACQCFFFKQDYMKLICSFNGIGIVYCNRNLELK